MAIIDPGPDVDAHVRALVASVEQAEAVRIVLTHHHGDHAEAAPALADALGAEVYGPAMPGVVDHPLLGGDEVPTDAGALVALHTPGHTRDHLSFLWPERMGLFAGDLLLGSGDTTWVADYPGCVAEYLETLARLRPLNLRVIYPAHGPPLEDPPEALDRFEGHRRTRIAQVEGFLDRIPAADAEELLEAVYGDEVPASLKEAAAKSLRALVDYVRGQEHP